MKVFIEEQKFTQPIIIIGLSVAFIAVGISSYNEWSTILEGSISEKLGSLSGLIIILLVGLLFLKLKLKTRVDEKGIYYQYFPFHLSYKLITWESISNCYIRNYDGISEFGGWGMKFSFRKNKVKSFTTKGNIGLQIELSTGNKILIGTQKKEELQRVLTTYQYKIKTHEI
ncbi:hypothetical protein [uncultured Lutibacter sp.]|uniref:hypothetical protein n=1 Tax=uncultured Lutibacter sp. TaxID=437739 RepID=UPI00261B06DC|nr:hypothetical protein [uncultured Lutibacter sp.]